MDVLTWKGAPGGPIDVEYPSSDGMPMAETETHALLLTETWAALKHHFRARADVYVVGNVFLYYQEGDAGKRRSPDLMVVKGVDARYHRNSFKTWVENAVPCAVFEFTSHQTEDEDQGPKKLLYQELGVQEYFLFDPFGDWLPRRLVGYRLIKREEPVEGNGHVVLEYEELQPARDGGMSSHELGLRLKPEELTLAFFSLQTGERLLTPPEAYVALDEARREIARLNQLAEREARRADQEKQRADQEKKVAEREKERADQEKQRADEEKQRADEEKQRADEEKKRADEEKQRADALARSTEDKEKALAAQRQRTADAEDRAAKLAEELERLRRPMLPPPAGEG